MSYKWNHIIYVAFRVWLHSLKMHRRFIPVAAGIKFANFHYWIVVHLWMYYSSFIQSLKRCGIVSSFPCYAPVLHYHRKPAGTWSKARNGSDLTDMAGPPQAHLSLSCERHAFWQLHRTGKGQISFQSLRKAMPKNPQTTTPMHSSHMLVK